MNKRRGYISVELGGETHKLKYDCNALALFEERMGQSITSILATGGASVRAIKEGLYAGLAHEGPQISPDRVGRMMELRQLGYYAERVTEALRMALGYDESRTPSEDGEGEAEAAEES